jgi:stage III sporulation protein AG
MALTEAKKIVLQYIKKYSFALMVLLTGILFLTIPEQKKLEPEIDKTIQVVTMDLQDSLSECLSKVHGAGKVEVLLTQKYGEEILYQTDDSKTSESIRTNTVLISDTSREKTGLVRQINPPVYEGAIILCQGADHGAVRLALVDAVKSVTGLTSDRITILKMK